MTEWERDIEFSRPAPYPYQVQGAAWLAPRRYGLLADDMGLGKSVQAIHAAVDIYRVRFPRFLIICPAIARANWANECQMWAPPISLMRSPQVLAKLQDAIPPSGFSAICSYEYAAANAELFTAGGDYCTWPAVPDAYNKTLAETVRPGPWDLLILDEVHYLAGIDTNRSTKILGSAAGMARIFPRVWALSGTPIRNHPADIWTLARVFGATSMSYDDWVAKFCTHYRHRNTVRITGGNARTLPELNRILNTFMLRRRREEVNVQLPPIRFLTTVVPGPAEDDAESAAAGFTPEDYDRAALEKELLLHAMGETPPNAHWGNDKLQLLLGLAQATPTLQRYFGLQKVDAVAELYAQRLRDDPALKVFLVFVHRAVGETLYKRLKKPFGARLVYGGVAPLARDRAIDDFQKDPRVRVMIGQVKAIGISVNLTAADRVGVVEVPWCPADLAQAILRAHRIGRTRAVDVEFLMLQDSLDQPIVQLLKRKTREISLAVDGVRREMDTGDATAPRAEDLL